jgi:LppX_LprAFG lipoprotein
MKKIALLLVAAPLMLAACGGSSNALKVDPVAYVKQAAHKTASTFSEHMTLTGSVDAGGQTAPIQGSGDFANAPLKGDFSFSLSAPTGESVKFDEVFSGKTLYVRSPSLTSHLPSGKKWASLDFAALGHAMHIDTLNQMSESPTQALQRIEAAGTVKQVGSQTIDGVQTTHFQVTNLDLSKLAPGAKLPATSSFKYGPIDVWVGNDTGYVYRESMSFDISESGQTATMKMQTDFSKFGEPVHVTVPTAKETVDMTKRIKGHMG